MDDNQLIDTAYSYLPIGLADGSPGYNDDPKAKRLIGELSVKQAQKDQWDNWIAGLRIALADENLQLLNWGNTTDKERACKLVIRQNGHSTQLVLLVSLIVPYYIFYERTGYFNILEHSAWAGIEFSVSDQWFPTMEKIAKYLQGKRPEIQPFPTSLLMYELENVMINNVGIIESFHPSPFLRKLTLFDFFFCENAP